MNHIYRLVWSPARVALVVVSELAKAGKGSSSRAPLRLRRLFLLVLTALASGFHGVASGQAVLGLAVPAVTAGGVGKTTLSSHVRAKAKDADAKASDADSTVVQAADEIVADDTSSSSTSTAPRAMSLLSLSTANSLLQNPVIQPAAIAPANPKYPAAPDPGAGVIVGPGGVVGSITQLLGPTAQDLFGGDGYLHNGNLAVNNANLMQAYYVTSLLGIPLVNLSPAGTALGSLGGAATGSDSHLTLVGGVRSDSYIYDINNGDPNGLLGLVLPNQAPAWSSTCANLLGLISTQCWAVNAAQDYQVLMGDGATANGSKEVVIGSNASHTLPAQDANVAFPGGGTNDPSDPTGVPTSDYEARLGHSVVIGDDAAGTANGQTILGAEATSDQSNSVALGYRSGALRGPQLSYVGFGLAAPQHSAGEVSIGTSGQERQITNVAAGSADTDAVNVSQLMAIADLSDNAVQYDDVGKATITLGGAPSGDGGLTGGTLVSNLSQGTLSAGSTDAVNGAQLFATNVNVTNLGDRLATIDLAGTRYFHANSTGAASSATGVDAIAVGVDSQAIGDDGIAVGQGSSAAVAGGVAVGQGTQVVAAGGVALGTGSIAATAGARPGYVPIVSTAADTGAIGATTGTVGAVSVGNAGAGQYRQITGVAAGTVASDAVNVAQLTAVDDAVATLGDAAVQYDDAGHDSVTLHGMPSTDGGVTGGTTIGNVHQGDVSAISTDAVNGSQLFDTNATVTVIGTHVTQLGNTIAGALGGGSSYDVGAGTLAIDLHYDGNDYSSVQNVFDQIGGAVDGGGIKYFHASSTLADSVANGVDSIAIGPAAMADAEGSIALGSNAKAGSTASDTNVALGANSVANGSTLDAAAYNLGTGGIAGTAPVGEVSVGSVGNERRITHVAAGAGDTDAVNVSQLKSVVSASTANAVQYDDASHERVTLSGTPSADGGITGGTTIGNVHQGDVSATSTDAVNGAQLFDIAGDTSISYITDNGGGVNYVRTNDSGLAAADAHAQGAGSSAVGYDATSVGVDSVAIGRNASALDHGDVALGAGSVSGAVHIGVFDESSGGGTVAAATAADAVLSIGSAGHERQIQNVASGVVSATSTDAVNGSQLFSTNSILSGITGGGGIKYFHANSMLADGLALGSNSIAIGPAAEAAQVDSIAIGNGAIASDGNSVALGAGSTTSEATATAGATIAGNAYVFAGGAPGGVVSIGSVGSERLLTNVAAGQLDSTSTQAVNGSQLFATNTALEILSSSVKSIAATGGSNKYFHAHSIGADSIASGTDAVAIGPNALAAGTSSVASGGGSKASGVNDAAYGSGSSASGGSSTAVGSGSVASGSTSTAVGADASATGGNAVALGAGSVADRDNSVSVGNGGQQRQITNVAAGTRANDAVNMGQLAASQNGSVHYDSQPDGSVDYTNVTLGSDGGSTTIHNVADGEAPGDAANMNQLNEGVTTAENWSKSYTDQRFNTINRSIQQVSDRANAGVAAAIATAGLPQAYEPGKSMAAIAGGSFRGESSLAIGISTISEGGRWIYKLTGSSDSRGDTGVSIGAGMQW